VEGVKLRNLVTDEESVISCDAVFLAIGYTPNTNIFKDEIELDHNNYIVARNETRTNIEGVFVAGDVADFRYRQAIAAAGSGCKAALDAEKYLIETEN
jgi:thioredoxin reductase (NADPH)